MILQIEITPDQIKSLVSLIDKNLELENIKAQLIAADAKTDDSQAGEIPVEGDNEFIKRME
ncbi:hypothetical protein GCM10023149_33610 [Mucilaginibacter gynuensis]|uniref:Uncharacterized protein n=1 Tax=Mucilaginibacter gynuensis TaxID=1302236 RepID=A0ABP8GST3_9SPHI